jgi:hypothetical protein
VHFSFSFSLSHCKNKGKRKNGQKVITDEEEEDPSAEKLEQLFWKQIPNRSNVCLFKDHAFLFQNTWENTDTSER